MQAVSGSVQVPPEEDGARPGYAESAAQPVKHCNSVPYATRSRCGPLRPNPEAEAMTILGLISLRAGYPRPSRSMTPVEKFSITTSLRPISSRTSARARSSFRFRVMLRLPGFISCQEVSRWERSGRVRDSILMTSAPSAPRYLVQIGPAITQLKSTIRTPWSGLLEVTSPPGPLRGANIGFADIISGAERGRRDGRTPLSL